MKEELKQYEGKNMKKYILKNMDCASCATKIEDELSKMDGVKSCSVNFANASLHIDTDNMILLKSELEIESGSRIN